MADWAGERVRLSFIRPVSTAAETVLWLMAGSFPRSGFRPVRLGGDVA
jgi:hypothetical protein